MLSLAAVRLWSAAVDPRLVYRRGSLLPDPRYDAVRCIVMAVMDDDEDVPDWRYSTRMLLYDEQGRSPRDGLADVQVPPLSPPPPSIPRLYLHCRSAVQ